MPARTLHAAAAPALCRRKLRCARGLPRRRVRRPRRAALAAGGPGRAAGEPLTGQDAPPPRCLAATPATALARGEQRRGAGSWAPTYMWGPAVSLPLFLLFYFFQKLFNWLKPYLIHRKM